VTHSFLGTKFALHEYCTDWRQLRTPASDNIPKCHPWRLRQKTETEPEISLGADLVKPKFHCHRQMHRHRLAIQSRRLVFPLP
jgi:hypothetical protein